MKLLGYAPNVDPATEGALVDVTNCIPTQRGMAGAPSAVAASDAAAEELNSAFTTELLDGSNRTLAGSLDQLYELSGTTWTDRSRAVGGAYNCPSDGRWDFAQYGDSTLAVNKGDVIQKSDGVALAFADISGSPQATMVAVSNGFVMVADTFDGTYGDQADRWWCSAYFDVTDWTPAIATQCTTGRIVTSPGGFKALKSFGDGFVLYKKNAIFVGSYVGAPIVWQWDQVEGDVGTHSQGCVINAAGYQYFLGNDDFYRFDGVRTESIGAAIRDWFYSDLNLQRAYKTIALYNQVTGNIWWCYVSSSNSGFVPDKMVIYNIYSGKWGKTTINVEAFAKWYEPGLTYHSIGTEYATYDDLPTDITYDSPYWLEGAESIGIIKDDHIFYSMNGASASSSMTLNNVGDNTQFTTIRRVRPRFTDAPDSSTMEYNYDDIYGDSFTTHSTVNISEGRYDILHSSRWHQCKLNMVGDYEIIEVDIDIKPSGIE